jgi:hypothetical protein
MATPNYEINYDDKRFTEVETDKKAALNEVDVTYGNMINNTDKYYQNQINAVKDYADKQTQLQNEKTDFAIQEIEQNKAQAKKDYTKEQSGAYVDWQKQSNQYGAEAEQRAASGLSNTGYAESSLVSMYNTYQNRVVTARESYQLAVQNYNNSITEARLQNNSVLAEIANKALQQQLELSLQGFQYKNQLLLEKANKQMEVKKFYADEWQKVLDQINRDNALKEEVRQADMANARQQEQIKIAQAELKLQQDKFAYEKQQDAAAKASAQITKSGGGDDGSWKTSTGGNSSNKSRYIKNKTGDSKVVSAGKTFANKVAASVYINALIKSGASKDKVANEIAIALREGAITKEEAQKLRNTFTPRGVQY